MNPTNADNGPQKMSDAIHALLADAHAKGEFDGVALVGQGDTVLYRGALGLADRKKEIPHALDRPFPICSITKQFTALLVMQQVALQTLELDKTVVSYLPDFDQCDTLRARITIRHLLTHQSGLRNLDAIPGFYQNTNRRIGADPAYVVNNFLCGGLTFAPGSEFSYNNGDYFVLAHLLQKITGTAFNQLLTQQIWEPLGMQRTSLVSGPTPRRVPGYEKVGADFVPEPSVRLQNFGASGAMQSTVDDLFLWNRALLTDKLLPRAFRNVMWTPDASRGYVACGSWVYAYLPFGGKTPTLVERQGGIGGIFAQNLLVPEDEICVTLLTNGGDAAQLAAYTGQGLTCDILRAVYES